MNLFESVKAAVTVRQAVEHYGLEVNRGNMVCCPFHNDRTPSMKLNEDYFYCFGCGAHGDVIDLVARLFNLSSYDVAKKLAYDFGIDPDKPPSAAALRQRCGNRNIRWQRVSERGTALSAGIMRLSASFGALEGAVRTQNTGGIWGPHRNPAKRFRWGEDEQRNE